MGLLMFFLALLSKAPSGFQLAWLIGHDSGKLEVTKPPCAMQVQ